MPLKIKRVSRASNPILLTAAAMIVAAVVYFLVFSGWILVAGNKKVPAMVQTNLIRVSTNVTVLPIAPIISSVPAKKYVRIKPAKKKTSSQFLRITELTTISNVDGVAITNTEVFTNQ